MKKENTTPDLVKNEEEMLKLWSDNNIFNKLVQKNENSKDKFAFLDGPVTANYPMGLHHAWNRSLKDIMLKYNAMCGKEIHFQNGFDSHGLPVELSVEKALGINSKKEIEKMGIDKFIEACMDRIREYSAIQTEQSKRLGQWMDWDNSYYTNSDENITSIWFFLKKCYEKGWIVEKYRPTPWCTRCGTALSEHEMSDIDAYKDVVCDAVFFKLPIKNSDMSLIVWTTTPWTLSSNVAVAVNPELDYVVCRVKSDSRLLVIGKASTKNMKDDLIEIVKEVKGSELVGLEYETCFEELEEQKFAHKVVAWDAVDETEGSGMVHIAPGCGAEDFDLGQTLGLKNIIPIDEAGNFYENFGFLASKNANEVADLVFDELKKRGKLYYTHKYKHRYPHCWRCKNPVLFRLVKSWVIKMDEIRPELIKAIDDVEFQPDFMKKRMLDWLNNMGDWSISRKRYYGIPLPFYVCPKCGELTVVGSLAELKKLSSEKEVDALPHIHRPYIDDIKITCPKCGEKVERVKDVGDCWLDAGITPFSTKKYFTDKEFFEKNFPIECVIEGKEQVRLWFYSLLVMSVVLTGKPPYKKIVCTAMLLAQDGSKLSKSSPNNIPINEAFNRFGADVIRYLYASNNMISDTRFGFETCDEIKRKLLGLWNNYVFFSTYANLDNPALDGYKPNAKDLKLTDRWLVEVVNNFIENSKQNYESNKYYLVVKDFENLVGDISNWYIRTNRRRFWKSDDEGDKLNAYWALYVALKKIYQVMAPILPFECEYYWQNMVREIEPKSEESVLLTSFPNKIAGFDEAILVEQTDITRNVITLASRLRNENQIKVKQPLKTMFVIAKEKELEAIKTFESIIKDELNIKEIDFVKDNSRFNDNFLQVNFKTAGAVLKGEVQKLRGALIDATQEKQDEYVKQYHNGQVKVDGFDALNSDCFILASKPKQDFVIASENDVTLVLDITIDEQLMLEGALRELIRNAQVLRKEAGLKIEERIQIAFETKSQLLLDVLAKYKSTIMSEVLAKEIKSEIAQPDIKKEVEACGEQITISIKSL